MTSGHIGGKGAMIETRGCWHQHGYWFLILKLTMIGECGGPTVYFVLQLSPPK